MSGDYFSPGVMLHFLLHIWTFQRTFPPVISDHPKTSFYINRISVFSSVPTSSWWKRKVPDWQQLKRMEVYHIMENIDFHARTDVTSLNNALSQALNSANALLPLVPYFILLKGAFILGKYHHWLHCHWLILYSSNIDFKCHTIAAWWQRLSFYFGSVMSSRNAKLYSFIRPSQLCLEHSSLSFWLRSILKFLS